MKKQAVPLAMFAFGLGTGPLRRQSPARRGDDALAARFAPVIGVVSGRVLGLFTVVARKLVGGPQPPSAVCM
jgi:hypothetical protein